MRISAGACRASTRLLLPAKKQEVGDGENAEPSGEADQVVIYPSRNRLVASHQPGCPYDNHNNDQCNSILLPGGKFLEIYFYSWHSKPSFYESVIVWKPDTAPRVRSDVRLKVVPVYSYGDGNSSMNSPTLETSDTERGQLSALPIYM